MDSSYQEVGNSCYQEVGKGLSEGSRSEIVRNSIAWLRKNGYMIDPSEGSPQQEPFPSPNHWGDYSQGDNYVACNSFSSMFPSDYGRQEEKTFEAVVIQKLDSLQAQMYTMARENEEIGQRIKGNTQTNVLIMEMNLRDRFEEGLKAYEDRIAKRLEEHFEKIRSMYELLESRMGTLLANFNVLHTRIDSMDNHVDQLEKNVGKLYFEMYKSQGKIVESESDDDCVECIHLLEELPGYHGESIEKAARNDSLEIRCESTSLMTGAYNENERLLCEDIISLRGGCPANEAVPEYSMDIEGMREWDHTACSPVKKREYTSGAELPLHREESSLSPKLSTCYSCEIAYAPQIQACFGALASSASRGKSHEEPSWDEKDSTVDFEEQKRKYKQRRQVGVQVWIPKGTLEVMKVFHMTKINLGETSCVPHKAKKRKRRRKSSNPQSGIG